MPVVEILRSATSAPCLHPAHRVCGLSPCGSVRAEAPVTLREASVKLGTDLQQEISTGVSALLLCLVENIVTWGINSILEAQEKLKVECSKLDETHAACSSRRSSGKAVEKEPPKQQTTRPFLCFKTFQLLSSNLRRLCELR